MQNDKQDHLEQLPELHAEHLHDSGDQHAHHTLPMPEEIDGLPHEIARLLDEGILKEDADSGDTIYQSLDVLLEDIYEKTAHLDFWDKDDGDLRLIHYVHASICRLALRDGCIR